MMMLIYILVIYAITLSGYSLYVDLGHDSFIWFQRSGAFVVLAGAILAYRSIFRLGVSGVGGAPNNSSTISTVVGCTDDGKVRVKHSQEYIDSQNQISKDRLCGYFGAILTMIGTVICGYGDLLALLI